MKTAVKTISREALDWPFFQPRHHAIAEGLDRFVLSGAIAAIDHDDVDRACRKLVRSLGEARLLDCAVAAPTGDATMIDSRSICLSRESLAYADGLADFMLRVHAGDCRHLASAAALLLRAANVPARLADGFLGAEPGERPGTWSVWNSHAHVWVEVLSQSGWIPIDPTSWVASQEQRHLDRFNRLMADRRVRPTALQPVWNVAGFALGAVKVSLLVGDEPTEKCCRGCINVPRCGIERSLDAHQGVLPWKIAPIQFAEKLHCR